jgi:hypothetical protein
MKIPNWLSFQNESDGGMVELLVLLFTVVLFVQYSSMFEHEYHVKLIDLYVHPWWRLLIVFLVIAAAMWSMRIGLLIAFIVLFYLSDMNTLITPISDL